MSECSTKIGGKQDVKTGKTFKDAHMSNKRKTWIIQCIRLQLNVLLSK